MINPVAPTPYRWHTASNLQDLHDAALTAILDAAMLAIRQRGAFHLVISGGETPRKIYQQLRTAQADWSKWHIYFSDERCLPTTDKNRNSRMAGEAWLDLVPIPESQIYIIPTEIGAPQSALRYAAILSTVKMFDLVLLGLGEDGHTASLFPNHDWGDKPDSPNTLAVINAPKPPSERVSLSATRLSHSRGVLFIVAGESKRNAVAKWRHGENIPAQAIVPEAGVDILIESDLLAPFSIKSH
ncbi:MAG: 6-phosphogluconolactonase [Nitrosomonadaceae bacterium]|nr:6-phosphogluconolactonase [Nitrosomonadaceae bacterium]MDW7598434.1 6-phosphogluconolactonase [Nitrosomonadaceae bacterium]MDW7618821.1 6-phosphogluconolactonase [Nitrosomonadaceae bacterium]MDW7646723.1 6-phosphogluconolactonase [Nitrosomonadaceae bacterium]MDW7666882.1 6-phosphogluconolactonase [Nitrosomonadaceae bacterium]